MKAAEGSERCTSLRLARNVARSVGLVLILPLALVNVELLDEFRFSVFLQTLSRVELSIAMLTQSQSYRRKPDDSKFAMGHYLKCVTDRQSHFSSMSDSGTLRT
jgi:hypothetical protein